MKRAREHRQAIELPPVVGRNAGRKGAISTTKMLNIIITRQLSSAIPDSSARRRDVAHDVAEEAAASSGHCRQHGIHTDHCGRPVDAVNGVPAVDKQAGHDARADRVVAKVRCSSKFRPRPQTRARSAEPDGLDAAGDAVEQKNSRPHSSR